ncbi:Myb-like DNA-binding domain containing protein [Tritrichomonas foetus]|uniref:Myb-like DNA-binding domain containing protein n=1 Tax=Tritrichomonas foetus TaxID=1144522 RepID=A0A1J4JUS0_9EUKA|nr:Myb-like DNA-binding domain containing protein [Tritrichomonas foetus]|eukprot:OHT01268.1 Myb-like DNA-binding domain containing protein [Tritrichomonas foetus]
MQSNLLMNESTCNTPNNNNLTGRNFKPHEKFTIDDDATLRRLVAKYGENNWNQIALMMPGRKPRQCKERWMNYLTPSLNTSKWIESEDQLLLEKVSELGFKWVKISKFFENRTDQMVKNRFHILKRKEQKRLRKLEMTPTISTENSQNVRILPIENCSIVVNNNLVNNMSQINEEEKEKIKSEIQIYQEFDFQNSQVSEKVDEPFVCDEQQFSGAVFEVEDDQFMFLDDIQFDFNLDQISF